jgi:hypothetical protein
MGQHWVAIYIDANSKGEYYYPTGRPSFLRDYVNFTKKHCHTWTYNTFRVQEEGSTVCGHHFIFIPQVTQYKVTLHLSRLVTGSIYRGHINFFFIFFIFFHLYIFFYFFIFCLYTWSTTQHIQKHPKKRGKHVLFALCPFCFDHYNVYPSTIYCL